MSDIRTLVFFSSGISSWAAAKRWAENFGTRGMVLLFADTLIEDEDNYRFLHEAAENIGAPLEIISHGKTPWELFRNQRMIANTRADLCSRILKRELLNRWRDDNCDPDHVKLIYGLTWEEPERAARVKDRVRPWDARFPMLDRPWMSKRDTLKWAEREGIRPPRLYDMGFGHANCGGFCVKAGHGSFKLLLERMPARYAAHEAEEEAVRALLGKDVAIMKDRSGGDSRPLTMREFRERIEQNRNCDQLDLFNLGGCGCALPD